MKTKKKVVGDPQIDKDFLELLNKVEGNDDKVYKNLDTNALIRAAKVYGEQLERVGKFLTFRRKQSGKK